MRDLISLSCDTCKSRNYTTSKNKKTQTDKFSIKKFCPRCRSHTVHKEGKVSKRVENGLRVSFDARQDGIETS